MDFWLLVHNAANVQHHLVEGSGGGDELEHREASGPRAGSEREGAMCLEVVLKRQVCTFSRLM
jgi:hypothetical protein